MTTRMPRRLAGDDGVSLVEMMVSILILGVVLSAFASTLTTTLVSLSRDELRVRATHLANEAIEDLRATPWSDLGFYADDAGFVSTYTGASGSHDSVQLGPTRGTNPGPLPGAQTTSVDGVTYTTTTNVYWIDDEGDGLGGADADSDLHDVKAFHVLVQWTGRGRSYQLANEGLRPPTIDEVPLSPSPSPTATVAPGTFAIADFIVLPTAVTITTSGVTREAIVATLTTTMPAIAAPTLHYNGVSIGMHEVASSGATQWTFTVSDGNSTFLPGSYDFTVDAFWVAGGTDSATIPVTFTQESVATPVTVMPPSPTPGPFCRQGGNLRDPVMVQWEVDRLGNAPDMVVISLDGHDAIAGSYLGANATGTGSRWQATLPAGLKIGNKSVTVTITATRAADAAVAAESYVYPVGGGC